MKIIKTIKMKIVVTPILAIIMSSLVFAQSGLSVGQIAPDFKAKDQNGKTVSLNSALKNGKVVVLFYRGYWCPNCSRAIKSLQDSLKLLSDKNITVIAVSPEGVSGVEKTINKSKAKFSILSDKDLKISNAYKVAFKVTADMDTIHKKYNIDVVGNNAGNGNYLVKPSAFIVGKDGKISYRYLNDFLYSNPYSNNRVTVKELLENL